MNEYNEIGLYNISGSSFLNSTVGNGFKPFPTFDYDKGGFISVLFRSNPPFLLI